MEKPRQGQGKEFEREQHQGDEPNRGRGVDQQSLILAAGLPQGLQQLVQEGEPCQVLADFEYLIETDGGHRVLELQGHAGQCPTAGDHRGGEQIGAFHPAPPSGQQQQAQQQKECGGEAVSNDADIQAR